MTKQEVLSILRYANIKKIKITNDRLIFKILDGNCSILINQASLRAIIKQGIYDSVFVFDDIDVVQHDRYDAIFFSYKGEMVKSVKLNEV